MGVRRYQDLHCWKLANELKRRVYDFTAKPPASLDLKFCDQIRDSARSAPRTIAEGFGRFRPAEFARYLEFARGSLMETHNHLTDALDLKYLTADACKDLQHLADRAIGATTELLKYLRSDYAKERC
jgi:four helix bundle protein